MKTPEPENPSPAPSGPPGAWSEEAIERLLREFYRDETPPELRATAREVAAQRPASRRAAGPSRTAGAGTLRAVGAGLAVVCVLLAVVWLIERPDTDGTVSSGDGPRSSARDAGAPELPRGLAEHRGSGRPRTAPVESPDALRPVADGGFGPGVDKVTEWDIEVFPIDDPSPRSTPTAGELPAVAEPAPHRAE